MQVQAWDSEFVRVRRRDVHPVLADLLAYPTWWPGLATEPAPDGVRITLRPPRVGGWLRRQRLLWRVMQERPGLGLRLACEGDLVGELEWYYLDERAGVVVHYLAKVDVPARRWRTVLADHRALVRAGLHALKDRLEAGRPPGREPEPWLLAAQREAIRETRPTGAGTRPRAEAPRDEVD